MSAIVDTIADAAARRTANGYEITRTAIVKNLSGSGAARLVNALSAPGLPAYGTPHPAAPSSFLQTIEAEPYLQEDSTIRIRLVYAPTTADTQANDFAQNTPNAITGVRFQAVGVDEETQTDRFGVRMLNEYTGPEGIVSELVTVALSVPRLQVTIGKNLTKAPKDEATKFIGVVNSSPWSGYAPRTWLCNDLQSQFREGFWRTDFTFIYNPDTWDTTHILKIGGVTPSLSREGNGVKTFENYEQQNFNDLGVSF